MPGVKGYRRAMKDVQKAALIGHPLASTDTTLGTVRIAITGGAQSAAVPSSWQGKFFEITNDSAVDLQYAFSTGSAGVTLVNDQACTPSAGSAAAGKTIFAGASKDGRVRVGVTYLNWVTPAASTGFIEVTVSETPV